MFHSTADPQPSQLVDAPDDDREREHDDECFGRGAAIPKTPRTGHSPLGEDLVKIDAGPDGAAR
jgi:hypothetical protein